jgi:hypothetical protein
MFTGSFAEHLIPVWDFLFQNGIAFDYVNSNPEVPDTETGNFTDKFYFNFLIDDKAGFDAETDWEKLYNLFKIMKEII